MIEGLHGCMHLPSKHTHASHRMRMHPSPRACLLQGYDLARKAALEFLETFKQSVDPGDREVMRCVARTSLNTKLAQVRSSGRICSQRSACRSAVRNCTHAISNWNSCARCLAMMSTLAWPCRQWQTG
jgi:hypothetical protein